ncbi:uncharacterized protein (DUF1330 family) [Streptomyces griseochromogenes]|uniref:Uncharacterized protein (DUF1330 family) n=1 Tax=Streptomyces griseochromogenes TaxID=68214 RepID=A0A1B1AXR0_9ACTN|nr:DUF1330 domain-containing protein [Streptomyces griseochromogenes]ANP51335.1 hypothetical protein AVL59_18420 [Streptomyces griseochromogenes]MBP2049964.1 uncharacterized protein (DUF1330 family) [Streptomyces griseochromogenes]
MSTYLINHLRIPGDIPNEAGLSYLEQVEATAKPYGGKWLANGEVTVVEGAWPGLVVLMEFPDRTAARQWYDSAAYQDIRPLRTNNSISDIVLIDSLPPDYTVKGFAQQVRAAVSQYRK